VGVAADAAHSDLVINATPLGMDGTGGSPPGEWPIDPALLGKGQWVVDLVYHPLVTPWLRAAGDRGAGTANGLGMLVHQAALQLVAWTGVDPPVEAMWAAVAGSGSGGPRH
jgi:shikimate dehydrogenase